MSVFGGFETQPKGSFKPILEAKPQSLICLVDENNPPNKSEVIIQILSN